jgi:uncharacterized protein GlcG (DUF336 family)
MAATPGKSEIPGFFMKPSSPATVPSAKKTLPFCVKRSPSSFGLRFVEQMLPLPGGLAMRAGDEVVGAIGVGGAPGGDKDERYVRGGIEKIQKPAETPVRRRQGWRFGSHG